MAYIVRSLKLDLPVFSIVEEGAKISNSNTIPIYTKIRLERIFMHSTCADDPSGPAWTTTYGGWDCNQSFFPQERDSCGIHWGVYFLF
jgi:hypothetical protein